MGDFIRQLTHDNQQLSNQWPEIHDKIYEILNDVPENDQSEIKVKELNALADYILADIEELIELKLILVETIIKTTTDDPIPSVADLVPIFCRVLGVPDTNNLLNLTFIEKFYNGFQLGERLSVIPSIDLIDLILNCLQKHEFTDETLDVVIRDQWDYFLSRVVFTPITSDTNNLNNENTMIHMRSSFQQLCR